MNFETDYKNIHFHITLEKENVSDLSQLMGDKFNRLPNQTLLAIKKGELCTYNVFIVSKKDDAEQELTHYLSSIILTSDESELMDEIADYLDNEKVLDDIERTWKRMDMGPGPVWRIRP